MIRSSLFPILPLTLLTILMAVPQHAAAEPQQQYERALRMAAQGDDAGAVALLKERAGLLPAGHVWRERMEAASTLLDLRRNRATEFSASPALPQMVLVSDYLKSHAVPNADPGMMPALLGTLFPGAGHLWLGRIHDAGVAAMLVLPMLALTIWAVIRRMGPVTVFFALITLWLWSGTVYSALSLAERSALEAYLSWWSGAWQASGLPGRPW